MSYSNSNVQESYRNTGSNRAAGQADNCDEGSQHMNSAGSHDEYRSRSRGNAQRGGNREATTGYYREDFGSGSSSQSNTQRGFNSSGKGHDGSSSGNAGGRQTDRYGGSSTGYTGGSTTGHTENYGSSFGGHASGSTGGYRGSSGGYAGGSAGGYGSSASGNGSGSSGQRVSFSVSSSSASSSGGGSFSGGLRSTSGYSNRSSGGRQGFSSGFSGVSANGGFGGFSGGIGGQRGDFSTESLSGFLNGEHGLLQQGEKETMQNLNCRLSDYMAEVKALEKSNSEFENKIRQWYETHKPKKVDNSKHYKTIEDLKDKIMSATMYKNELTVKVDNLRLAAEDFRVKYESERHMCHSVESDIEGLRKALDDMTLEKSGLEGQVEILKEEMASNKKNHEQEMKSFEGQTCDVSVQLDAIPCMNMIKVLNDMRADYEELAEEYRRKAEQDYNQKISELSNKISCCSTEIETGKSEVTEIRRCMETMEIDLQSQLAMKSSLENTLAETQCRYASQLAQIQQMVSNFEEQIAQVRNDMENQSCEHKLLQDAKTRLENEINMYRRLLEGENSSSSGLGGSSSWSGSGSSRDEWSSRQNERYESSSITDPPKKRLVTKITEESLDGKLVLTKIDRIEQKM